MAGLYAKIEVTKAERGVELTLLGILFALPLGDHVHQSLTTQPNLMLEKAQEVFVRFDTGVRLHLAGADSANAAPNANCWTCNFPGTSHTKAIKDLLTKRCAATRSSNRARRNRPPKLLSPLLPRALRPPLMPPLASEESSGEAALFTGPSNLGDEWVSDTGASSTMTGQRNRVGPQTIITRTVRVRFLLDLVSYCDVRVQSNPFLLKETNVYSCAMVGWCDEGV